MLRKNQNQLLKQRNHIKFWWRNSAKRSTLKSSCGSIM